MLQAPPAKSGAKARGRIRRKSIFEQNLKPGKVRSDIWYICQLEQTTGCGSEKGGALGESALYSNVILFVCLSVTASD